ncbi:MAG: hypothetical protein Q9162_003101 [Coniocarpon cinnabarinum]
MFSDYSVMLSVVPFLFLTEDNHVLSPSAFRLAGGIPENIRIQKVFLLSQLESLQEKLRHAKEKDQQQAKDLLHALSDELPSTNELFSAWEHWATVENVHRFRTPLLGHCLKRFRDGKSAKNVEGADDEASVGDVTETHSRGSSAPHRPPTRSKADAHEAKVGRRAEIERRCAKLSPPLDGILLEHMDAFGAAMQISMPLTEDAWQLLKPKLLAQRRVAQQRLREQQAASHAFEATTDPTAEKALDTDEVKERWEKFQRPVRADLERYVDELTRDTWADGKAVNRHTAPRFAAEALVSARNRYASERPERMQSGNAFRLVLHNMKWVYEHKIKPLTEVAHGARDIFACAECGGSHKMFAFDSLIQHFAAKHTSNFSSKGSGIAWYEAPWPQRPPFRIPERSSGSTGQPVDLISPSEDSHTFGGSPPSHPDQNTLYQPVASMHRPPLTSPGFAHGAYGPFGAFSTPSAGYSSMATSPAYSAGHAYPPPSRFSYHTNATSPFDVSGPPFSPYHNPHTPVQVTGIAEQWAGSPGYPSPIKPLYLPSPHLGQPSFLQVQSDAVAAIAKEVWDLLVPVKQIPPSVRFYVLINHTISRFKEQFSNEPNIDLFARCVNDHISLRAMKDANGLACKVCVLEKESREEGHSHAFPLTGGERKLYSFSSLLSHFKQVHVETKLALENAQTHDDPEDLTRHDWKEDMIELPDDSLIEGLMRLQGMSDPHRMVIVKAAFPTLFENVEVASTAVHPASAPGQWQTSHEAMGPPDSHLRTETSDALATQGFIKIEPGDPYAGPYAFPAATPIQIGPRDTARQPVSNQGYGHGRYRGQEQRRSYRSPWNGHLQNFSARRSTRSDSTDSIPDDLLRSLTGPHLSSQQSEPTDPRAHVYPRPMIPPYRRAGPPFPHYQPYAVTQSDGNYGYVSPSALGFEPEEDVEYIHVQRSDRSHYGF